MGNRKEKLPLASLSNDPGGRRRIQFVDGEGNRKSIRLGKLTKRAAETVKHHVEQLNGAAITQTTPHDENTALAHLDRR